MATKAPFLFFKITMHQLGLPTKPQPPTEASFQVLNSFCAVAGEGAQAQRLQLDESSSVLLVVRPAIVFKA
jgi:hypothetical protein